MNNEEKILSMLDQIMEEQAKMREEQAAMREDQKSMREELTRVAVIQENKVIPCLDLLFEGQKTIQEQIKRLSVIDSMQEDISILKAAVRSLSSELEEIKKAM